MEKEYQVHYTEAAEERLESLKLEYVEMLEDIIKERKHVPGDKFIEITASDLEQASQYLKVIAPRKSETLRLLLVLYALMGIVMVIVGLFYPFFIQMVQDSPERLMLTIGGATLTLAGIFGYFRIKQRDSLSKLDRAIREYKANK
ncbi:hypothetical protein ACXOI2_003483 [Vibrio cholerae]|nr:hypothetical protein [Vibrio cholerae]